DIVNSLLPIHFSSITTVSTTPSNSQIGSNDFFLVEYKEKQYWALFQCPCGCGEIISLSLQNEHHKSWYVVKSKNNRPTLHPSVWQNEGCYSHFIITDGRIYWCGNNGFAPDFEEV
ncbi:MAG: hypothetical protein KGZ74_15075, partial [Chitinophagaceae bacterium]|nr:hypothetical protein [Chitinophagaceae bacterium]